jgi:hypothetical protein
VSADDVAGKLLRAADILDQTISGLTVAGPWKIGDHGAVVSATESELQPEAQDWYGGKVVGESLGEPQQRYLILTQPAVGNAVSAVLRRWAWLVEMDFDLHGRVGGDEIEAVADAILSTPGGAA